MTVTLSCQPDSIDATIVNGTGAAVTVGVANVGGPVFQQVTVPAGGTDLLRVDATVEMFYQLEYRRLDTGEVLATYQNVFACETRAEDSIRVVSGAPITVQTACAGVATVTGPTHGSLRQLAAGNANNTYVYTSDPGYVGPDRFDYLCHEEGSDGTVFITVVAAAPEPTPSVRPAQPTPPTLPATGSTIGGTVILGAGLLLAGAILIALTRRRA